MLKDWTKFVARPADNEPAEWLDDEFEVPPDMLSPLAKRRQKAPPRARAPKKAISRLFRTRIR